MTTLEELKKSGFEQFASTSYENRDFSLCMRLLRQYENIGVGKKRTIKHILLANVPYEIKEQVTTQCKLEGLI